MVRLQGRVALVTGASRGIGRATALRLAGQGAAVGVNYHSRADAAHDVVEQVRRLGGRAVALQADVANPTAVDEMAAAARAALGPIDILVNNAGLLFRGALLDYEKDEFEQMWRVNVKGILHVTAAVAPSMIERKYGRIINLSSIAAVGTGFPDTTLYAATKAAVLILTKRFALELGAAGVTVNAVLPGLTVTDMVSAGMNADRAAEAKRRLQVDAGARRPTRRHRQRDNLSGFRGIRLHDRPIPRRRRRPDGFSDAHVEARQTLRAASIGLCRDARARDRAPSRQLFRFLVSGRAAARGSECGLRGL
jgi:3-oxoacyl-[acyl-carrier protein] reductase